MKIHFDKWRTYHTPHFTFIPDPEYIQISFVVLNLHWYVIFKRGNELYKAIRDFALLSASAFAAYQILKYVIIHF